MTVTRTVTGAHYGLRDWLAQRFTALVLIAYTFVLLGWVFALPELDYGSWSGIFAVRWMKVFTFVALLALIWHTWVGVRDIFMDYIKPIGLRIALQFTTIVVLLGYAGWAMLTLWSV